MNLNEYQTVALDTAIFKPEHAIIYPALGLCNEAGEVAGKIKKLLRDETILTRETTEAIRDEIGDTLWYVAVLANSLGYTLEEVAEANLSKLKSRAERGTLSGSGDDR